MGRPSKFTDKQLIDIQTRFVAGETASALAREYGVTEGAIRLRVAAKSKLIKDVANQLVTAEQKLAAMDVNTRFVAITLADKLRAASMYLADSAIAGARAGAHLKAVAGFHAEMVTRTNAGDAEGVALQRVIAGLTQVANESEKTALNLLAANKEVIKERDTDRLIRVVNSPDD